MIKIEFNHTDWRKAHTWSERRAIDRGSRQGVRWEFLHRGGGCMCLHGGFPSESWIRMIKLFKSYAVDISNLKQNEQTLRSPNHRYVSIEHF